MTAAAASFHNQLVRPCLSELLSTTIFSFLVSFAAQPPLNSLQFGVASGLALLVAQTFGNHVSGAHLNPAVSISHLIHGRIGGVLCGCYIVLQVFGAFVGAALYSLLEDHEGGITRFQAFVLESLLVSILCVVHLRQDTNDETILVPASWALTSLITLPLIGPSCNVALSFGSTVVHSIFSGHFPLPSVFYLPPLASILGAFLSSLFTFVCREAVEEAEVQPVETPVFSREFFGM